MTHVLLHLEDWWWCICRRDQAVAGGWRWLVNGIPSPFALYRSFVCLFFNPPIDFGWGVGLILNTFLYSMQLSRSFESIRMQVHEWSIYKYIGYIQVVRFVRWVHPWLYSVELSMIWPRCFNPRRDDCFWCGTYTVLPFTVYVRLGNVWPPATFFSCPNNIALKGYFFSLSLDPKIRSLYEKSINLVGVNNKAYYLNRAQCCNDEVWDICIELCGNIFSLI